MSYRTFEWDGDYDECRAEVDKGNFDADMAQKIGRGMYRAYKLQKKMPLSMGWSLCSSTYFDYLWTHDIKVKELSEREAKILFLAASNVLRRLLFPEDERSKSDLQERMSKLSEMSHELNLVVDKHVDYDDETYDDRWQQVEVMENEYQTLFSETLTIYGEEG